MTTNLDSGEELFLGLLQSLTDEVTALDGTAGELAQLSILLGLDLSEVLLVGLGVVNFLLGLLSLGFSASRGSVLSLKAWINNCSNDSQ